MPVGGVWRTIKSFIFWSYERGTVQYDVMVTLILVFVLFSPRWIDFKDRPVERNPQPSGVVVMPDPGGGLIYQVEGKAVQSGDDATVRAGLLRIIEPISGGVSIKRYEAIKDKRGQIVAYKVWAVQE